MVNKHTKKLPSFSISENNIKILSHPVKNSCCSESRQQQTQVRMWSKTTLTHCWGECNLVLLCGNQNGGFQNNYKIQLMIPCLGTCSKDTKPTTTETFGHLHLLKNLSQQPSYGTSLNVQQIQENVECCLVASMKKNELDHLQKNGYNQKSLYQMNIIRHRNKYYMVFSSLVGNTSYVDYR